MRSILSCMIPCVIPCMIFVVGCSKTSDPSPLPDPVTAGMTEKSGQPIVTSAVTGRTLFCAHGGVGVVPNPLPPGYETELTSVTLDLDNPNAKTPLTVKSIELMNEKGNVVATMRRVVEMTTLDATKTPPGRAESGSWAFFLNPQGTPFDGNLPPGRTRLRIRASLTSSPTDYLTRVRVTLDGGGGPIVIEGDVWGSWPT
jgi:hypothetical protein